MSATSNHNAMQAFGTPKWPRQYAAEIIAMPSADERSTALAAVPASLREWVKYIVDDQFARAKFRKKSFK